jgi:hypothetical protein
VAKKLTNAQKAENAIDRALKPLTKSQREQVLSNYVEPATPAPQPVEEEDENLTELRRAYASYRAGGEPLRGVESILRRLFPETR